MTAGVVKAVLADEVTLLIGEFDRSQPQAVGVAEAGEFGRREVARYAREQGLLQGWG